MRGRSRKHRDAPGQKEFNFHTAPMETALPRDELALVVQQTNAEPRSYQSRVIANAVHMFEGTYCNGAGEIEMAARSVMVESPTGSGKTIMGLLIARLLQSRHGIRTGWVAMRRNLLAQATEENRRMGIGVEPLACISMFDKNPPLGIDLLIVDEAQHDAAASMAHLHNVIQPRWILGLTATPFRTDTIKLCFDRVIRDAGIHQLIQDGFLSEYDHYTIPEWNVSTVAEVYLREPQRWGKSIFFFATIEQCLELQSKLSAAGVLSELVTGESDRETQIERFRNGEVPVLINCLVLTEGFDSPDLQTVFCRDSGKGPAIQMCGRVLRKHPDVPIKNVVQGKLTRWPFTRVAQPHQQWLWESGEWRCLKLNPLINQVSARVRKLVASISTKLPAYVQRKGTKGRVPRPRMANVG